MCRIAPAWMTVLALWGGPLAAQDSLAALQRMEVSLDSMRDASARRISAAQSAIRTDTVVVGGLRIATAPPFRPMAQAAAEEAWSMLLTRFGPAATIEGIIPVMDFGGISSVVPGHADLHALARGFAGTAAQAIWRTQGAEVLAWMRGNVPTGPVSPADLSEIAAELSRTPARADRSCALGDVESCASAFGLRVGTDTLDAWYDSTTWPQLAALAGGDFRGIEAVDRQRCMNQVDLPACRRFLTPERLVLPIGVGGRQYLVQLALESGGASAFQRLTAGRTAPMEARLAAAAGISTDTLLLRWSVAIRAAKPRGPMYPPSELWLALGWSMLLLVAVTRSTRWR